MFRLENLTNSLTKSNLSVWVCLTHLQHCLKLAWLPWRTWLFFAEFADHMVMTTNVFPGRDNNVLASCRFHTVSLLGHAFQRTCSCFWTLVWNRKSGSQLLGLSQLQTCLQPWTSSKPLLRKLGNKHASRLLNRSYLVWLFICSFYSNSSK